MSGANEVRHRMSVWLTSDKAWGWPIVPISLLLLLLIGLGDVNQTLFLRMNAWGQAHTPEWLWMYATFMADSAMGFALMVPFALRYPRMIWATLIVAVMATLLTHGLKNLFDVYRPVYVLGQDSIHVIGPALRHGSMPSGHTISIFALLALVALGQKNDWLRYAFLLLALLGGISRIMVGAHWPMDVCAGAAVGWISGFVAYQLALKWQWGMGLWPRRILLLLLMLASLRMLDFDGGFSDLVIFPKLVALSVFSLGGWYLWQMRKLGHTAA